jgi:hypothetical protein
MRLVSDRSPAADGGVPSAVPAPGLRAGVLGRRWRQIAVGLAVAALAELCVGVVGLAQLRSADHPVTTRTGVAAAAPRAATVPDAATARAVAIGDLLERRSRALLHRDRAGWLRDLDPSATSLRRRQSALFDNLAAVPLASWQYVLHPEASRPLAASALRRYAEPVWAPAVDLRYALRAVDTEPTLRPQVLTFVRHGGRWYLTADDDAAADGTHTWRGLWDFGPVVVRHGSSSLILAHPSNAGRLAVFADTVDSAVPRVTSIWGRGWSRQVAVLIPDSTAEMAQLVGPQFALSRIAAVAVADYADPRIGLARGQRVVVNPDNIERLGVLGRRVVLLHEITHVATRAVTADTMPTWLVEGFADYVGYRDSGLPVGLVAQELRAAVRRGGWRGTLPSDADFRADAPGLAVAYEEAWLACRLIADRAGEAGLVRLYRQVGTASGPATGSGRASPLDAALRAVLHMSAKDFLAQWSQAVRAQLG